MNTMDLVADVLTRNLELVKGTLADFSDQDMLARPVPGANHAAWQLGHVTVSETRMLNAATNGAGPALPAGFEAKFTKETAKSDDAKAFPSKAELLEVLGKTRAASAAWAKGLTPADMEKPAPEMIRFLAPTVGHLALLIPTHLTMHIGQFQVIRRKLGKPVLF